MGQMTIQQAFDAALQHHQAGRLAEAEGIYRGILAQQPGNAMVMQLLGVLASQVNCHEEALKLLSGAVALSPNYAEAHGNLGLALQRAGRREDAISSYRKAIALKPGLTDVHNNLGLALREKGQWDEAIICFGRVLELQPESVDGHNNLGMALEKLERFDEAIDCFRRAITLRPEFADGHNNLGSALQRRGSLDEAIGCFQRALLLRPDFGAARNNLGNALLAAGRVDEAIACFGQVLALQPDLAEAHNNLGNVFKNTGRLDQAIAAFRQAIILKPDYTDAHSNLILTLLYHPDYDVGAIAGELRHWNQQHAEPLKKYIRPHNNGRDPQRRLRIGYVSPDFYGHVVGWNLLPLLREHNHEQVEVFCYANSGRADALTEKFRSYSDVWRSIVGVSDADVCDLIRQDGIDILVDLSLHTADNRLTMFARKPAPVQVTFAGYPGSTGLEAIDYRLTDPNLDPPGAGADCYSETSIRLPNSFWCYDPLTCEPEVNALPVQTRGYFTFGCLNNFCKVNDAVLELWAEVLKKFDRSRLILLSAVGSHRQTLLDKLQREGIDSDRIEVFTQSLRRQYLELYHRIDLGLDTFPYNGHTTSLDSFWMGVPVVTLAGRTVVGRAGLSQLNNLGLQELIARTPQEYVQIATDLGNDLPRLAELRRTLRGRMLASPLMDARRFARDVESVYRQMWRTWCEGG